MYVARVTTVIYFVFVFFFFEYWSNMSSSSHHISVMIRNKIKICVKSVFFIICLLNLKQCVLTNLKRSHINKINSWKIHNVQICDLSDVYSLMIWFCSFQRLRYYYAIFEFILRSINNDNNADTEIFLYFIFQLLIFESESFQQQKIQLSYWDILCFNSIWTATRLLEAFC